MREIEDFLAASTGTPIEEGRPTMHLPAIPDGASSRGGRARREPGRGRAGGGRGSAAEERIPEDVTEAELRTPRRRRQARGASPEMGVSA